MAKTEARDILMQYSKQAQANNFSLGIGRSKQGPVDWMLYDLRTKQIAVPLDITKHLTSSVDFDTLEYSRTVPGKCVSV